MAFNLNNLLSTLDSSIGLLDSSSDLLSILQAINVTNPTMGHGKSQKKTYATRASLPAASVSLRGSLAVVQVIGNWEASGNADNGLYVCTGNDWALVQGLDSAETRPVFQGSNFGYSSGAPSSYTQIDKFPFSSNSNATAVGDLTQAGSSPAGQSSQTDGYVSGMPPGNAIEKFPFSSDFTTATDVGDLTLARTRPCGQSDVVNGFGYATGGLTNLGITKIDKFPFSSNGNSTDIGETTQGRYASTGQSDTVNGFGYTSGGQAHSTAFFNIIDKFPFASDFSGTATDVGDLGLTLSSLAGQSSSTHGYTSGGLKRFPNPTAAPNRNYTTIYKFPFSSNGNSSGVGNLTQARGYGAGQSSTTHGYTSGAGANGQQLPSQPQPPYIIYWKNTIDKFPFASDEDATDVGDLTGSNRTSISGQQY